MPTVDEDARARVDAAPSLVEHLNVDALSLVADALVNAEKPVLAGKWTRTKKEEDVTSGRLQTSAETVTLWLRGNGEAQYRRSSDWTSYKGATADSGEFGAGGSSESIVVIADQGKMDTFLTDEPARAAAGKWSLTDEGESPTLQLTGSGNYSAGAFEDDDILYHGSGKKEEVKYSVSLEELRQTFTHEPI
mmetsp:Transcript_6505/g.21345  ORF Transcript_6505/g.21345 Transcript_6505/m.21345 type:complete len:191 (+) Transcript_6505:93-665(+)